MNDMSSVIVPKSDQINADDLIAGPMTITIAEVQISGGQEQPVSIYFEGSQKAFRPCKSMSRVLVQAWGPDASKYIGRALTLYRDPTVKWGGLEVGGIRISHMSHIEAEKLMMLTATKGSRKPHKVLPLVVEQTGAKEDGARKWATAFIAQVAAQATLPDVENFVAGKSAKLAEMKAKRPELHTECEAAIAARRGELAPADDDGFSDDFTDGDAVDADTGEVTSQPTPELTPAEQTLANIRESIAGCKLPGELATCDKAWLKHRAAYDDDTAASVDAEIATKRRALSEEEKAQ